MNLNLMHLIVIRPSDWNSCCILNALKALAREKVTVVFTTHDPQAADKNWLNVF